jgi:hypothetical protein
VVSEGSSLIQEPASGTGLHRALRARDLIEHLNFPIRAAKTNGKANGSAKSVVLNAIPRIAFVGMLEIQYTEMESYLAHRAKCEFVNKTKGTLPTSCDILVAWPCHISPILRKAVREHPAMVIEHDGGIATLRKKLDKMLDERRLSLQSKAT